MDTSSVAGYVPFKVTFKVTFKPKIRDNFSFGMNPGKEKDIAVAVKLNGCASFSRDEHDVGNGKMFNSADEFF